jgi:hypothetical protein
VELLALNRPLLRRNKQTAENNEKMRESVLEQSEGTEEKNKSGLAAVL